MSQSKSVIKKGQSRFYFPEFPDHVFNGAFAHARCGGAGTFNGKPAIKTIETFENSQHNNSVSSGYWEGEVVITAKDFGAEAVLVKQWYAEEYQTEPDYFYLVNY